MKMQITRDDAVTICLAMAYATAPKWNRDRMNRKMKEIAEMDPDGLELDKDSIDSPQEFKRLSVILRAMGKADEIEVVKELDAEPEPDIETAPVGTGEDDPSAGDAKDDKPADPEGDEPVKPSEDSTDDLPGKPARKKGKGKGKKKPEDAKAKPKEKKATCPKILDKYSAGPFVRWLGRQKVSVEQAKVIVEGEGCKIKEVSIKWELKEKREGRDPAKVSKEDAKLIRDKYPEAFMKKGK